MTSSNKEWKAPESIESLYEATKGNKFAGINRPTAGARVEKELERGNAPFQLYSLDTPNGIKVNIMLEELGVKYDAHRIVINGDQFTSGFVDINPNSKIPAMIDQSDVKNPIKLFESGSILLHLADKFKTFIPDPSDVESRAEVINWLMWQMGSAPYIGQFGHFFKYAPSDAVEARNYGVSRYGMEVQRLLSVLDNVLKKSKNGFVCKWGFSIADIAIFPWVRCITDGYHAENFLGLERYKAVVQWMEKMMERPAVKKGLSVCPFPK